MLDNLTLLKDDMVKQNWTICSFLFFYNNVEYIVLVKRFVGTEQRVSEFALVKLHFMKVSNLNDDLHVEANRIRLIIEPDDLRNYFGIINRTNNGDILQQFTERLGNAIPTTVASNISSAEKNAMVHSLSKSDSEDPRKIYCTGVRRNPSDSSRSDFNADKTKLLRPSLFKHFENDNKISFCYSIDENKENDDAIVLKKFASNSPK